MKKKPYFKSVICIISKAKFLFSIYIYRFINQRKDIHCHFKLHVLGRKGVHSFFGYYDISPFNNMTDEIVYISLDNKNKIANIVLEDLTLHTSAVIATSRSWNWQQGCRLRWMPNEHETIVFNDFINEKYCTRILNVRTNNECILNFPIYDINKNGTYGITLDFARLGVKRPGYGYTLTPYLEPSHNELMQDGILLIDVKKNICEKLVSYKDIMGQLNIKDPIYCNYYLNHLSFSPSGNKFLFFCLDSSTIRHESYMLIYDLRNEKMTVLEPILKVSHYVWESDDSIIATCYDDKMRCSYYRYSLKDSTREQILPDILKNDGHPSVYKNGIFLTDTYPDKYSYQSLFFFDENKKEIRELLKIFSSPIFIGEKRTDLHPRFNLNKSKISFDANVNGVRRMYYFNI
jgi:hypothetical protein